MCFLSSNSWKLKSCRGGGGIIQRLCPPVFVVLLYYFCCFCISFVLYFCVEKFLENVFIYVMAFVLFCGLIYWLFRPTKAQRERREKREQIEREKRQIELLEEISRQQQYQSYHSSINDYADDNIEN